MTASALVLSAALLAWKTEIEERAQAPVVIALVEHEAAANTYHLPADVPRREVIAGYLKQDEFLKQFERMYAVMLHHKEPGPPAYLILLNGARRGEWGADSEALVAHELGHAWIKAQGYPTPVFVGNRWACVGVHAGDITQHGLIRTELERRGIEYKSFWLKRLEEASGALEKSAPAPESDRCARLAQVAQLVDVRLGLAESGWAGLERYEAAVRKAMPEVELTTREIVSYLKQHDMAHRDQMREALVFVFEKLRDLGYQKTKDYRVYATLEVCWRAG